MTDRVKTAAFVTSLVVLVLTAATVSAAQPRPECNRADSGSLCDASITIFTFVDRTGGDECDTFYNNGIDAPISGARVTFVTPDGRHVQEITGHTGILSFADVDFLPGDEAFITIEYPALYQDMVLVPCRSSPVQRRLTRDSFSSLRSTQVVFCAGRYLPTQTPGVGD